MRSVYLLVGALVLAHGGQAFGQTRPLTDVQMARITAGHTEAGGERRSGVIVGNSSTATLRPTAIIDLKGSAQQGSRALNMVNSAQSSVANGINVWDGRLAGMAAGAQFNVGQANLVFQDQRRSSHLGEWKLEGINLDESFQQTHSITFQGQVVPAFLLTTIPIGVGFAGAGTFTADIGAGAVSIDSVISTTVTTTEETCVFFGTICHTETDAITDTETVTGSVSFGPISMQVEDGSACLVIFGTCSITASLSSTSEGSRTILVPASMTEAEAEYIVMSDGTLDVETDYSVLFSESAQQSLRVLNGVNAAGSVVANAVNVSRAGTMSSVLNLTQRNFITQRQ